jgi:hypothetical protein
MFSVPLVGLAWNTFKRDQGLVYFCRLVPHFEVFHSRGVTVNKLCEFVLL